MAISQTPVLWWHQNTGDVHPQKKNEPQWIYYKVTSYVGSTITFKLLKNHHLCWLNILNHHFWIGSTSIFGEKSPFYPLLPPFPPVFFRENPHPKSQCRAHGGQIEVALRTLPRALLQVLEEFRDGTEGLGKYVYICICIIYIYIYIYIHIHTYICI